MCRGTGASAGAASGQIVFTSKQAQECKDNGQLCILVCNETTPKELNGLHVSVIFALLTDELAIITHKHANMIQTLIICQN